MKIDNHYFEGMITQTYHTELQLNKADSTEAPCLDLYLSNGFVSSRSYDKRVDFYLKSDVPRAPFYDVYISQLI